MAKLKVLTILGTRPEIIRLSEVIKKCDQEFEHYLVHTGQNYDYELNQIFFDELGIRKADYYLDTHDKNIGHTIANIIAKTYDLIKIIKPDAVLILGDTNSSLASLSAKRLKCPIFHMEAGNRCGDWNVPETINRKIVDHIADFNMPYTKEAYINLKNEGLDDRFMCITGSPMKEVLTAHKASIESSDILCDLSLNNNEYIVLSMHREENVDIRKNLDELVNSINAVANYYKMPIIFSTHPRTRKVLENNNIKLSPYIKMLKPLGFFEYIKLQKHAYVVISDSGTLTEESYMLNFPAVLIRTSTERIEGIKANSIIMSGLKSNDILQSIEHIRAIYRDRKDIEQYEIDDVSTKVVEIIKNNIDIINKQIWLK